VLQKRIIVLSDCPRPVMKPITSRGLIRDEFTDHPLYNPKDAKSSPDSVWYGARSAKKVKVWCTQCLRYDISQIQKREREIEGNHVRNASEIMLECKSINFMRRTQHTCAYIQCLKSRIQLTLHAFMVALANICHQQ
jgi:hypothetical protein